MNQIVNFIKHKVFFENHLLRIKHKTIRNYWLRFFSLKRISIKIIILVYTVLISSILFFSLRQAGLDNWKCFLNAGSGLNAFSDNQALNYALKSLFSALFILLFIFFNDWYFCLSFLLLGWNSLLNVIDKTMVDVYLNQAYENTVVDYIPFEAFNFYNNIADILIFGGLFILLGSIVYYLIKAFKEDKNDNDLSSKNEELNEKIKN